MSDCPEVDLDSPSSVHEVYLQYISEYPSDYRGSLQGLSECQLNNHLLSDYGTADYLTVTGIWASDPSDPLLLTGVWGYGHAGEALLELNTMQVNGASNADIETRGQELIEYYYVREAIARCQGLGSYTAVGEWLNPFDWYEDSRLDYFTPKLFIDWYIGLL